jgi:hypothetical protein
MIVVLVDGEYMYVDLDFGIWILELYLHINSPLLYVHIYLVNVGMRRTVKTGFWIGFLRVRLLRVFTVEVAIIFWTSGLVAIVFVLRTANESDEIRQLILLNVGIGKAKS